jgi:hypothetical protein
MARGQIQKKPQKKKEKKKEEETLGPSKKKLKELDQFIEGVLQEAGEEFLDQFKQIEGD